MRGDTVFGPAIRLTCKVIGTASANQNQATDSIMHENAVFSSPEEYNSVAR